jgi:hypothetical protein
VAKRHCRNCICFEKCLNRRGNDQYCVEIDDGETEAPDSIARPRTLDYNIKEGEVNNKSNKDTDETVPEPLSQVVSLGEEEEDQDASTMMPIWDLLGTTVSDADRKVMEVYGNYIHQNDRSHLDGAIKDDAVWQEHWRKLVIPPPQRWTPFRAIINEGVGGDMQQKMELRNVPSLSNGNTTALKRGQGSWKHQAASIQMDGRLGSRKICHVGAGHRALFWRS